MIIVTCLNRYLGRCPKCKRDYDQEHHPNNLDCPHYQRLVLAVADIGDGGRDGTPRTHSDIAG